MRNAKHPEVSAAARTVGFSLPVMKITGTETPAAFKSSLSSMPDPSGRLMSRMTQTAFSMSVWLLKACADENKMGS